MRIIILFQLQAFTFVVFKLMKISLWSIGKPNDTYVKEGIAEFTKRISKYFSVGWTIIPVPKNAGMLSEMDLKKRKERLFCNG